MHERGVHRNRIQPPPGGGDAAKRAVVRHLNLSNSQLVLSLRVLTAPAQLSRVASRAPTTINDNVCDQ